MHTVIAGEIVLPPGEPHVSQSHFGESRNSGFWILQGTGLLDSTFVGVTDQRKKGVAAMELDSYCQNVGAELIGWRSRIED